MDSELWDRKEGTNIWTIYMGEEPKLNNRMWEDKKGVYDYSKVSGLATGLMPVLLTVIGNGEKVAQELWERNLPVIMNLALDMVD